MSQLWNGEIVLEYMDESNITTKTFEVEEWAEGQH